ncbi:MAG: hypothetical protein GYA51_17025 [Candidatus Methanofastidiosa archaeon]|nr:hypothetical protein [Candidatus Methanofastidiosa archaeon]
MNKKTKFYQEFFRVDFEKPDYYIILIECENDTPKQSWVLKVPPIDVRCYMNPYVYN